MKLETAEEIGTLVARRRSLDVFIQVLTADTKASHPWTLQTQQGVICALEGQDANAARSGAVTSAIHSKEQVEARLRELDVTLPDAPKAEG
jgi:hypothetical protein